MANEKDQAVRAAPAPAPEQEQPLDPAAELAIAVDTLMEIREILRITGDALQQAVKTLLQVHRDLAVLRQEFRAQARPQQRAAK